MRVTRKSRLHIRAQNIIFVILFLGILGAVGWLSTVYSFQADWTAGNRNTLTQASRKFLDGLSGKVTITAFARENPALRQRIREVVGRYQAAKSDIRLKFVNPDLEPDQVRQLGITRDGELVISYQGRTEHVHKLGESEITNALQRVARSSDQWVVFTKGHGERSPDGAANYALGKFAGELKKKGFRTETVNLAEAGAVPDNTAVLVIAGPQADFLPGEVRILTRYLKNGGNLLWLGDPGGLHGLKPVADQLGVTFLPGTVVDATGQYLGVNDPTIALVADYSNSPMTRDLATMSLFPRAVGLQNDDTSGWTADRFLRTLPRSWEETGKLEGEVSLDVKSGDVAGPITIGLDLTRSLAKAGSKNKDDKVTAAKSDGKGAQQRVVVIGDGDFLSNAYLNNGGNLQLGLNIVNWLSNSGSGLSINVRSAPDLTLNLSRTEQGIISGFFYLLLPLFMIGAGVTIWLRRRRR
ncbi:MAG: Gldg family protein [Gammaproteobacteria bacterium]|jgi:ABC-type uncharacterized transport system involved in gliding motility auxiliary subunit